MAMETCDLQRVFGSVTEGSDHTSAETSICYQQRQKAVPLLGQ